MTSGSNDKSERLDLIPLFDPEPELRLRALDRVDNDETARFVLRGLMLCDRDARVRAGAAAKLGRARLIDNVAVL